MDEITLFTLIRPVVPGLAGPEREEVLGRLLAAAASERAATGTAGQPDCPHPARRSALARRPLRGGRGVTSVNAVSRTPTRLRLKPLT